MTTSPAKVITEISAPQPTVYRIGRTWYAQGVTWSYFPASMRILGVDASHANELFPFSTRHEAKIALTRVQQRIPTAGQTVKWPVSMRTIGGRSVKMFRFGTICSTRGNYAIVATSTGQTERIRLDRLIIIVQEGGQA